MLDLSGNALAPDNQRGMEAVAPRKALLKIIKNVFLKGLTPDRFIG